MSDQVKGFVVTLKDDVNEKTAEAISAAISLIQGVVDVSLSVVDASDYINRMQVGAEMREKIFAALYRTTLHGERREK